MTTAPPGTYWIEPGRLLAGAHPSSRSMGDTLQRLEALVRLGVTAFIDLTERGEAAPYAQLLPEQGRGGRTIECMRMALPDHKVPATPRLMTEILEHMERMFAAGHCVYLHCRAGIGRTGTVVGCHLVRRGMDPEAALEHLQRLWEEGGRTSVWPHTPETDEQTEYVRNWGSASMQRPSWWKPWARRD